MEFSCHSLGSIGILWDSLGFLGIPCDSWTCVKDLWGFLDLLWRFHEILWDPLGFFGIFWDYWTYLKGFAASLGFFGTLGLIWKVLWDPLGCVWGIFWLIRILRDPLGFFVGSCRLLLKDLWDRWTCLEDFTGSFGIFKGFWTHWKVSWDSLGSFGILRNCWSCLKGFKGSFGIHCWFVSTFIKVFMRSLDLSRRFHGIFRILRDCWTFIKHFMGSLGDFFRDFWTLRKLSWDP